MWGLLLAYNLVRLEMARLADDANVAPTRISFTAAVSLICDEWLWLALTTTPGQIPPSAQTPARGHAQAGTPRATTREVLSSCSEKKIKSTLRVLHYENRTASKSYRRTRMQVRIVTTAKVEMMPAGQGWAVGRSRWTIENGTFNVLTHDYSLEHNYHHTTTAILALLVLRSLAYCLSQAYWRFAAARSKAAPRSFLAWWQAILVDDWVRYLDAADLEPAVVLSG